MSLDALTWARAQRVGNPLGKAVLINLADHHNAKTGQCNPSEQTIARETEMGESTVRKHVRTLEAGGWLAIVKQGRNNAYEAHHRRNTATR